MSEITSKPLMENENVKEFLSIMEQNGKDASGFISMLGYVSSMESQLNKAVDELITMRHELNVMREERDHPVRRALHNATSSLETTIGEAQTRLDALKEKIVDGCKNAVTAFKEQGATALNGIAKFFRIKPAFQALHNKLQNNITHDKAVIAKIEAIGTQYHTAGMHLRNAGRALRGKEPLTVPKPNGKLARLATAPFRVEMKCLQSVLKDSEKAIASLERLDERTTTLKAATADRGEEKPSVKDTMSKLAEKITREKKEAPITEKSAHRGAEI